MNSIHQLIPDIYAFLRSHETLEIPHTFRFGERKEPPTLRLSKMGDYCPRELWYSIHHPELAEPFDGPALIKFSYGHALEKLAIDLAKATGHEVCGEQDELVVDGIKGHRDCIIDGCVVDVKSCSSLKFKDIESGAIRHADSFGYLAQLDGYLVGSLDDDRVKVKDRGYLLAIDKTLGKMCLYEHELRRDFILSRIKSYKEIVSQGIPPVCRCRTVPDWSGSAKNLRLDVKASYNVYKRHCFPGLRTFLYKDGPHFLADVKFLPKCPELTKDGIWRYNT